MSYSQVQDAVPESVNIVAEPPRRLDMELAREGIAALDALPRPTLVTCRTGPRSSGLVYLYAGLKTGAVRVDDPGVALPPIQCSMVLTRGSLSGVD